jgi:hypothetical protein
MPIMLKGLDGIRAHAGFALGKSQWICVTDSMRSAFLLAVGAQEADPGENPQNGKIQSPDEIAHEFHVLSLLIPLLEDVFLLEDVIIGRNYALREVHFLAPVPVNSSLRLAVRLAALEFNGREAVLSLECAMECDATHNPVLFAKLLLQCRPTKLPAIAPPQERDHFHPQAQ